MNARSDSHAPDDGALRRSPVRRPRVLLAALVGTAALGLVVLAGCSSDSKSASTTTTSPQTAYCEAGQQLRTDVTALGSVDVLAEGTNGLQSAVDAVKNDLDELKSSADAATAGQIDTLQSSVDDLSTAVSNLGGSLSTTNVSAVRTAVSDVSSSASAVYQTLTDCP